MKFSCKKTKKGPFNFVAAKTKEFFPTTSQSIQLVKGFNIIYLVSSECAVDEAIRLVAWIRVVSSIHILFSWIMWNQIHDHGTSHLCVIDLERNVISMTTIVNAYFGSKILSPSTEIVLNNEMDDFSMPRNVSKDVPPLAPANFIVSGKRPLSSMTPTIALKNGKLKVVVGASGGAFIIGGTSEVLLNHFGEELYPFSSVMASRVYHQMSGGDLGVSAFPNGDSIFTWIGTIKGQVVFSL